MAAAAVRSGPVRQRRLRGLRLAEVSQAALQRELQAAGLHRRLTLAAALANEPLAAALRAAARARAGNEGRKRC